MSAVRISRSLTHGRKAVVALTGLLLLAAITTRLSAELAVGNLNVATNFQAELLYTVPKAEQGSWVSMTVDDRGRLIVSDQYGSLYRLTPPDDEASLSTNDIKRIDLPVGNAQGLLHAFDSLYVMVANDSPYARGLYRVTDTDGDDEFDQVELLRELRDGGEHGPHAILKHPDGESLTVLVGNQTEMTELSGSRVPPIWGEDILLPRLWDGNGFMSGALGPGGTVYRVTPDGKSWELQAVGFRNQYDGAYNRNGELFVFDADMEWDLNTPWYRPTRVNHVVSGAEFGWRSGASKWPTYYPDSLGAVVDIGPGSPTGVTFGYGARFPARYQNALYVCDWSYGKLYAVHLTPDGASYTGDVEEFATGQPLALTDVVVNPTDGAMYFLVGGRRTQSALYRITYVGDASTKLVESQLSASRARRLRRELEAFHGSSNDEALKPALKALDHRDRHVRYAARVALEWQPVTAWQQEILISRDPQTIIEGVIAAARVTGRDQPHRESVDWRPNTMFQGLLLDKLSELRWDKLSREQKLGAMRAYTLVFTRHGPPQAHHRTALRERFEPLFPAEDPDVSFEIAQLLVYLQSPVAAEKLVQQLGRAPTQEEQLNYAKTIRHIRKGWTPELQEQYFQWFVQAAEFKGGASLSGFLRDIKNDAVANLSEGDKARLEPILDAEPQFRSPMERLAARTFVKSWSMADWEDISRSDLNDRDLQRGRQLYGDVACGACHRFAGSGGAVGPDLTGVAGRFSARDLLQSIIEPSHEVSDQYGTVIFTLKNGETVSGRVANMSGEGLSVAENMLAPGDFTAVNRNDIVEVRDSPVSPMPEGLLDTLSGDEILDLVAFLMSGGTED